VTLEDSLTAVGVAPHAAKVLVSAASRPRGMIVLCGPVGTGKTTVAQLLVAAQPRAIVHWLGDLRRPEEIGAALARAESAPVVVVVRSGQSRGLRVRWSEMGLAATLVERASVVTATPRRLARVGAARAHSPSAPTPPDLLVLEILAPDGTPLTGSLADEARALVTAGVTSAVEARFKVPDYDQD
jgi:hypothetical protein